MPTSLIDWQITKPMTDLHTEELTKSTTRRLSKIDNPHETALILLAHVLQKPKTWLIAHPDAYLTPEQSNRLEGLVQRLCNGEPLPYLTGHQEFFGLDFYVTPDVLIPRPETELLVEQALEWLQSHPQASRGIDVGTGSGCIPISLLKNNLQILLTGADIEDCALAVASMNARAHHVEDRIHLIQSDLLENVQGKYDLMTANLPYIPTGKLSNLNHLAFEPKLALDGGKDGLVLINHLLDQAPTHLNRPGLILLEIESTLGKESLELAKSAFPAANTSLFQDLSWLDRIIAIEVN